MARNEPLKVWDDWSAGLGFIVDDGRTPGWYFGKGIRGSKACLAPVRATEYVLVGHEKAIDDAQTHVVTFTAGATDVAGCGAALIANDPTTVTTIDAESDNTQANLNNNTHNVAVAAGTDIMIVCVMWGDARTITAATYNGTALTNIVNGLTSTNMRTAIYAITDADDAGGFNGVANALAITFSGATDSVVQVIAANNVVQKALSPASSFVGSTGTVLGTGVNAYPTDNAGEDILDSYINGNVIACFAANTAYTSTIYTGWTLLGSNVVDATVNAVAVYKNASAVTQGVTSDEAHTSYQYFFEERQTGEISPFLYAIRGRGDLFGGNQTILEKFDTYGTAITRETGAFRMSRPYIPGQPARYKGKWYLPAGNDYKPYELTTVGSGSMTGDTITATAASFTGAGDHLILAGYQLAGVAQDGTSDGGVSLLTINADALTEANWGTPFKVGDDGRRPLGIAALEGMYFVLNVDGLYSFNNTARAAMVWEDYRGWMEVLANINIKPWNGGLLIAHQSGLLWWTPGQEPINVGIDKGDRIFTPADVSKRPFAGGRYHGIATAGNNFVYAIYQPIQSSLTAYVLCGYVLTGPTDLGWIILDEIALNGDGGSTEVALPTGIGVALDAKLLSNYFQPAVVYGVYGDLAYIRLDQNGSPFASPSSSESYTPRTTSNAWMSELNFPTEMKLDRIVVHTANFESGNDSVQLSRTTDIETGEKNIGPPIINNGRVVRDLGGLICYNFNLNVTFTCATAHSALPLIKRIELWGSPINRDN